MSAIENARGALDAINDNTSFGDGGIDSRVLTGIEDALRDLIAEHERLTGERDDAVKEARMRRSESGDFERERDEAVASLDARWEHSDHTAAKYYRRMRAAESKVDRLAEALEGSEQCRLAGERKLAEAQDRLTAPPTDDEREAMRRAVASVLWNAGNYPETVQARLLGQSVAPLVAKVTDALHAAGFRRPERQMRQADFEKAVLWERTRQIEKGYDAAHDDAHGLDHLLMWSQVYAGRGEQIKAHALVQAAREYIARHPQGPITEEWEYGIRADGDDEPYSDHSDDLDWLLDGVSDFDGHIVRRRKAGSWEPVEAARGAS